MHPSLRSALASQRGWRIFLQSAVSIALVAWLLSRFNVSRSLHIVAQARAGCVAAGFIAALLLLPAMAARFGAVLAKGGIPLGGVQLLAITWIGQFWNFFLPGSTGGDVYRLASLWSRYPERKADALVAVFVDRLIPTALLCAATGVGFPFLPAIDLPGLATNLRLPSFAPYLVAAPLAGLAIALTALLLKRRTGQLLQPAIQRLAAARAYWMQPDRRFGAILGWSILGHMLNFTAFFLFARAVGLPVTYLQVCCFLPLVLLCLILPISINGHGVREVLLVSFFHAYGIVPASGATLPEAVIALSVIGLSSDFVLGIVGALIFVSLRGRRGRVPILRENSPA